MIEKIWNPIRFETLEPLNEAETEFVRCLGVGEPCIIGGIQSYKNLITHGSSADDIRPDEEFREQNNINRIR